MDRSEQEAFEAFVRRDAARLMRVALGLTGHRHDAEDLLQTALTRVAGRWSRGASDEPAAYCRTVLVRLSVDRWRARKRRPALLLTAHPPELAGPVPASTDLDAELLSALRALPARQRAVVVLRHLEDLSEEQTADLLGISVGGVKSQSSRALQRLRDLIGTYEPEETRP